MPGPLVAGIAGSIGSAAIGAKSAKKAAAAQSQAADAQVAETRRQFDLIQSLLAPYVSAGTKALSSQLDLMGLGGSAGVAPEIEEAGAAFRAGDRVFATRPEAEAFAASNMTGAVTAEQAQQSAISGIEGGPQFRALVDQGEYALLANQSATGGLRGGDTMAAMAQFRPAMLQALIDKQLANYGGLAVSGQNAAAMTGTAAQNAGAQINQALGDRGAALAGGALAQGQAWSNAGSGILNTIGMMAKPMTPGGGAWQKWAF